MLVLGLALMISSIGVLVALIVAGVPEDFYEAALNWMRWPFVIGFALSVTWLGSYLWRWLEGRSGKDKQADK